MTALVIDGVDFDDLAARTLTAIPARSDEPFRSRHDYCRERVASDLAGLRLLDDDAMSLLGNTGDALRDLFATGLLRTAAVYGQTP